MAKPCRYRLPGQDTWMSEDEFKKSLADGLLDKFAIDNKIAVRNFKPDATAAEKFRAPVTETAPQAEVKTEPSELKDIDSTAKALIDFKKPTLLDKLAKMLGGEKFTNSRRRRAKGDFEIERQQEIDDIVNINPTSRIKVKGDEIMFKDGDTLYDKLISNDFTAREAFGTINAIQRIFPDEFKEFYPDSFKDENTEDISSIIDAEMFKRHINEQLNKENALNKLQSAKKYINQLEDDGSAFTEKSIGFLKDVVNDFEKGNVFLFTDAQLKDLGITKQKNKKIINSFDISEAYHKAKLDGSNPKLVKEVEDLFKQTKQQAEVAPTEAPTTQPTAETKTETKAETKVNAVESGADMLDKMSEEERDNFIDDWFEDRIPRESLPGGSDAIRFSEARKVAPNPMNKPKRLTMDNAFELSNFHGFVININGEIYGLDKFEDPDATSDAEDKFGDPKEYVWAYTKIKDGSDAKSVETYTSDINEVIDEIKASQKATAPKTETKVEPTTKERVKESGYSPTDNLFNSPGLAKNKTHGWRTMDEKEFNSLSSGEKTYEGGAPKAGNWIAGVPESAAKFGKKGTVMVEFGGIDIEGGENMSKGSTADKSNVTKVWRYNNETKKFEEAPELLDKVKKSEKIGEPKSKVKTEKQINNQINSLLDDLKDLDDNFGTISMVTDANGNINVDELLNAYNDKNLALEDTLSNSQNKVIKEIKSLKEQLRPKTETKSTTKKAETKPATEKVERKGPVEVEAETKRGTKVTYKSEVSKDGKTASVQQTYEAPFGGQTEGPRFANLPIKTDASGNRYVETKNETRVYVDKVKEAPKAKEAPIKEEVEGKGKPTKVKIYAREPKLDDRGMPIISKFNQEIEFTKNKRTGKWETTDTAGNKIEATEDQAARADKALAEQPKTTKEKISNAFDSLKIPKDRLFSIPYPVDIHNKIIELAKRSVLAGVDVATAIKKATSQVLEKLKANKLISEEEAKKIEDYNNSSAFTDKVNEAVEGKERVSGIKKELTSEESKELSEDRIERMTIKEALDAGEEAIKNGDVVPDKLITSIIGGKNLRTGQYENGQARPLTAIETAAMVYHKASLDNELENAYNDLNKALDSKNVIDKKHARAQIYKLEEKIAEYEVMANVTAYQQGLSLRLRSMMLNSEYDLVKQKAKIRAEYKGKMPADVEERLNELDKQLRETNAKLAELEKTRTKVEDEEVVKNIKETKDDEKKSAVSKDGKIKIPTADIRQAVINGATTIDEVVDAVRDSVKAKFPKATDRQIRDAITNYGKSRTETKDAIQKKINEMKRVGRLLSELEDIQNGIKKTKNEVKRDALTQRETELKQKIKEELAKIPLTEEEIADLQAEKLERFKKTSQKAIENLQKRIKDGDFEKKKRDPLLELDEEAAKLRTKREEVKFNFDLEFEKAQRNRMSPLEKLGEQFIKALSASKSLIASLDFSAPLRQGSVFVLSQNPKKTLAQLGKQFEFWWSEKSYNQWLNGIKSSEYYPLLKASGLYIAEENAKLTAAEEAFMNNFMTKIPLIGKTKVLKSGKKLWGADIYGRAERAYTGFLNNLRVQAFIDVAEKMSEAGISPKTNLDEYKSWADYVNNATGRGTAGKKNIVGRGFDAAAPALSLGFFSPRFLWSRLNLTGINPSMYYRMSPIARKQAIKRTMGYFGAATTILGLTALYLNNDDDDETSVETDPRSSDFGKIKIGNTRIDILAGNQQVFRTIAQAYSGERKKTTTGEIEKLGEKYGSQTRGGVVGNFFVNKFSPILSTVYKKFALTEPEQKMREEEGEGASDIKSIVADLTIPLYLQDVKDLSKDHGADGALGFTLLSIFGLGVQNIQPKQKTSQQSAPMDDFEKSLYEDDSYDDFERKERELLEGF